MNGRSTIAGDRIFIAILWSGFLVRLIMVWSGLCDRGILADDAYYYFTIARNAAAGLGLSFDGITLTNGFHPLYQILLVPAALVSGIISPDPWVLVHLALSLCSFLDLLSGYVLGLLLISFFTRRIVLWGTAAWMLGPWSVLITLRGLEGSLNVLLLALWLLLVLRHHADVLSSRRTSILLGALYGLAILARTDNFLYVGAGLIAQLLLVMRGRHHETRTALVNGMFGLIAAAVIVSPWAIWNFFHFQTIVQTSAIVKMENVRIYGTLVDSRLAPLTGFLKQITAWIWVPARYLAGEDFRERQYTWILIAFVFATTIPPLVQAGRRWRTAFGVPEKCLLAGAGTYLLCHVIVCTLIVRTYATWYASFPVFLFSAAFGVTMGMLSAKGNRIAAASGVALVSLLVAGTYIHFFLLTGIEPRGPEHTLAPGLRLLAKESPGPHVIGEFNAGALGMFAPAHGPYRVVNLDGLVNNQIRRAWKEGRAAQYMTQTTDVLWLVAPTDLDIWLTPAEKETTLLRFRPLSGMEPGMDDIRLRE